MWNYTEQQIIDQINGAERSVIYLVDDMAFESRELIVEQFTKNYVEWFLDGSTEWKVVEITSDYSSEFTVVVEGLDGDTAIETFNVTEVQYFREVRK